MTTRSNEHPQVIIPLAANPATPGDHDEQDLDINDLISDPYAARDPFLHSRYTPIIGFDRFSSLWRRVPDSWSVERDPRIAYTQLTILLGFLSLCIFIFSVPYLLYLVSPQAPTPPGTASDLDEAASMISDKSGAVAADHPDCSELGVKVMQEMGGNAVDATVSTVLCQGVLVPFASGLGGGAFILVHHAKDSVFAFYDARETAPAAAHMELYEKNATKAKFGGLAVAIPGELKGLYKAHQDWGSLPWHQLVEPVVEIAQTAEVGPFLAIKPKQMNETIMTSPSLKAIFTQRVPTRKTQSAQDAAASVELPGVRRGVNTDALVRGVVETLNDQSVVVDANDKDNHGVSISNSSTPDANATYTSELLREGDRIVNDALVETLKKIAKRGPDALYVDMADKLSAEIKAAGGIATKDDFINYQVENRFPVSCNYHGFTVLGVPLPSAGGVSIAMALNMVREMQFRKMGRNNISYKMLTETLKWVFGARMGLGDPNYVDGTDRQVWKMLSRREAVKRVFRIDDDHTYGPKRYSKKISLSRLEDGTSHISILDGNGTAVSVTSTINLPFGAGLVSNSTGILWNDQMDAFTTSATRTNAYGLYPSNENRVEGGKRPISSMSPTILPRNGEVFMVIGGSGGPKAISGVLQTILNVIVFGDQIGDAISAPRLHHQLVPNEVSLEGANATTCEQAHTLLRPSGGNGATGTSAWKYWTSVCKALKEGWADSSVTGLIDLITCGLLQVTLTLARDGVHHIEDIIAIIYEYIRTGKEAGIQKWLFKERASVTV